MYIAWETITVKLSNFCGYQESLKDILWILFQNEAIPETDEDPTVKVTESLSREGTPTEEDRSVERDTKQEEPDASATPPPPPPEEHSTEPTISEFEPLDTYLESGNLLQQWVFKREWRKVTLKGQGTELEIP